MSLLSLLSLNSCVLFVLFCFPCQVLKSYQDVGISAGNEVSEAQNNESVMPVRVSGVASVFLYFICYLESL